MNEYIVVIRPADPKSYRGDFLHVTVPQHPSLVFWGHNKLSWIHCCRLDLYCPSTSPTTFIRLAYTKPQWLYFYPAASPLPLAHSPLGHAQLSRAAYYHLEFHCSTTSLPTFSTPIPLQPCPQGYTLLLEDLQCTLSSIVQLKDTQPRLAIPGSSRLALPSIPAITETSKDKQMAKDQHRNTIHKIKNKVTSLEHSYTTTASPGQPNNQSTRK